LLLRNTSRAFSRALEERVARHGVSHSEWAHLWYISETEGASANDVSRRAGIKKASSTAALNSLERRGLIRRERDEHDSRRARLYLTAAGKVRMKALLKCAVEVNVLARGQLSAQQTADLFSALETILRNLQSEGRANGLAAT
jgi:DNA-binding MarR family transcriptional regulator